MPRPEQWDLRAALVSGVRGDGTVVGIVGASPVTGIAGTAGLGKTTTANWLALDPCVRSAFRDGVFWLEFGKERTAMQRLVRLAELLGVPPEDLDRLERRGLDSVRDEVARRLKDRCCLIILDDVWDEQQPKPFQQLAGGRVTVLMTTRKSSIVDAFGEQLARLELRPMEDEAATRLMVQSSGKADDELHGPSLAKLAKMCAGVPAMLRSVGRMCNTRSAEAVVKWFADHKLRHRMPTSMASADGYQQDAAEGNLFLAYEGQLDGLAERTRSWQRAARCAPSFPRTRRCRWRFCPTCGALTRRRRARSSSAWEASTWWSWWTTGRGSGCWIRCATTCAAAARARSKGGTRSCLGRAGRATWAISRDGYWEGRDGGRRFMHHLNGCKGKLGVGSLGAIERLAFQLDEVGDAGAASLALGAGEECHAADARTWLWQQVGDAGAASLASALEKNATLQTLELERQARWEHAGAASLASALETNATLQTLDLGSNEVGDAGAASLASALETNATLQKLSLGRQRGGRCGRGVARVGAREECHAADARPSAQRGG